MCTACVAQGVAYVGGAVVSLRVMAARAEAKRQGASRPPSEPVETASAGPRADS